MPLSVMGFYGAVLVWGALISRGLFRPKQWPLIAGFGLVLLLFLNIRYVLEGAPAGIAFFISLYDFFDNLGLPAGEVPSAMTTCGEQPLNCIRAGVWPSLIDLSRHRYCEPTRFISTWFATQSFSY